MKQNWMDAVMASDLNNATKVFAYGMFKRMYGEKVESYPGTETLEGDTGLHRSKYKNYRDALIKGGWVNASMSGRNYVYTLSFVNLSDTQKEHEPDTQRVMDMYPVGMDMYPQGNEHVPTGNTNTTTNTSKKINKEDTGASAPVQQREKKEKSVSSSSFECKAQGLSDELHFALHKDKPCLAGVTQDPAVEGKATVEAAKSLSLFFEGRYQRKHGRATGVRFESNKNVKFGFRDFLTDYGMADAKSLIDYYFETPYPGTQEEFLQRLSGVAVAWKNNAAVKGNDEKAKSLSKKRTEEYKAKIAALTNKGDAA